MTNILSEATAKIGEGITNLKGWAEEIEGKLPDLVAFAEKAQSSPIIQALEGIVLPPEVEQELAALITKTAAAIASTGSVSTTVPAASTGTTPAAPSTGTAAA